MDGYAFSSCDLARLAEVDGLRSDTDDAALPSEERIRQSIIQVPRPRVGDRHEAHVARVQNFATDFNGNHFPRGRQGWELSGRG